MTALFLDTRFLSSLAQEILFTISFFLLVAAWFFLKRSPHWLSSVRASNWPMTQGRVESVKVETFAEQALGEIAYSYVVDGERFSGYFSKQFATEQDAWAYVSPLQGQSLFVRYNSANPQVSAVRSSEQSPLFAPAQASFAKAFSGWLFGFVFSRHGWQELTTVAAGQWPTTQGRIESALVTHHRERHEILYLTVHVAEISYSYRAAGGYYSGYFERSFYRERAAEKYAARWKDKEVLVRHRPDAPEISALRIRDQEILQTVQV